MCGADELYVRVLRKVAPDARLETLFIADLDTALPDARQVQAYDGFIWTGSNLTIYENDPRVTRQIEFTRLIFEVGRPQFGSCWGVQMAAVAAGGEVRKNPHGREMGFARKLRLTAEGRVHPMYEGKPDVFDGFISHLDEVTRLPNGGCCWRPTSILGCRPWRSGTATVSFGRLNIIPNTSSPTWPA